MPTILETTIVALTVQVGSRDIDSICHETGLRSVDVADALDVLSKRRAVKRTISGNFSAPKAPRCVGGVKEVARKETLRP